MKQVLVIGSGLVAAPLIRYLLDQSEIFVSVAGLDIERSRELVDGYPQARAVFLDLADRAELTKQVQASDLVVSLLPATFHVPVAQSCIEHKKSMITASYVSEEMKGLDEKAKKAGVLILNEIGLDPGIDHMSASRVFHDVKARGGRIDQFRSYCGGLPAPEADNNPFGYKFSWSPKGVLLAGKSSARFKRGGKTVEIASKDLFLNHRTLHIDGVGDFEAYPNRDSVNYIDIYDLHEASTVIRATLRNDGWCESIKAILDIGFLGEEIVELNGMTYLHLANELSGGVNGGSMGSVKEKAAGAAGLAIDSEPMKTLEWLGLFSNEEIPLDKGAPIDVLVSRMLEKMSYADGERDMIVLYHEFVAEFPEGVQERITSTLVDYGIPQGDSAMSRTVGLPAAIAARLMLDGKIGGAGIRIPVEPEIYVPIMADLEKLGIHCTEKTEVVNPG